MSQWVLIWRSLENTYSMLFQVKFHPQRRDILASGSTDGLVCLFDISKPSEDEALYGTLNSESSVVGSLIDYIKHTPIPDLDKLLPVVENSLWKFSSFNQIQRFT